MMYRYCSLIFCIIFNVITAFKNVPFGTIHVNKNIKCFFSAEKVAEAAGSIKRNPKKPIILIDVDHVINMLGMNSCRDSWGDKKSTTVNGFRIQYSPKMVETINRWNTIAEVRWLTTWNDRAQTMLAPELKLDHFAVGREPNLSKLDAAEKTAEEVGPEGLIIWIDDELTNWIRYDDKNTAIFRKRPNTVLVSPGDGLRPEHVAFIDKILENPGLERPLTKCFEEECHNF